MILVDTSVLISALRQHETRPVQRLRELEAEGLPYSVPILCAMEVLQGARDEKDWRLLDQMLEGFDLVPPGDPWESHRLAARISFDCRRKGLTVRSSVDCLVAQVALDHEAALLHDDDDFERIAEVRPLRLLRG